ncbi:MAG: hypothetical protein HY905_26040 [Deltaproteobacteria bacterium]|nr:hypothetical protein [Deltaproteobacteria bacterium]
MRKFRWLVLGGALAGVTSAWVVVSCAIDDEITWITGEQCSGTCRSADPGSLACDTDSTCTRTAGCEDWDCNELPPGEDGADGDADAWSGGDGALDDDVGGNPADAGEGDVPIAAGGCTPIGGGLTREAAAPITLGVAVPGLWSCPATSQWFRFDAASGTGFVIDLAPVEGGELTFLLYAGDDPTPVASADLTDPGSFAARAGATTTYYLRVRSIGIDDVAWSLTVSTASP